MKTGFICASGFNMVATATRNGRTLIAVVLGANSSDARAETAAKLLNQGFSGWSLAGFGRPSLGEFRKRRCPRQPGEPPRRHLRQACEARRG